MLAEKYCSCHLSTGRSFSSIVLLLPVLIALYEWKYSSANRLLLEQKIAHIK